MRTTVRLDDRVLADAKKYAAETGRTLTSVLEDALRETLARRSTSAKRKTVRLKTVKGNGVRPGADKLAYGDLQFKNAHAPRGPSPLHCRRMRRRARGAVSAAVGGRAAIDRGAGVARAVPRCRVSSCRRVARRRFRLAAPRVHRRHVRQPPERFPESRGGDPLGR